MNNENEEPQDQEKPEEEMIPEVPSENQELSEEAPEEEQVPESEEAPKEEQVPESTPEQPAEEQTAEPAKASEDQKASKGKAKKESEKSDEAADPEVPEFIEKVISINRITKVTKGGKKLSFSALVVVGDTQGNVGYSLSKAAEVSIAIRKAMGIAKKNMIKIPVHGTTIPHEIIGRCSGSRVLLKPASDGTGVIASGPVRAVCDGAGIHNILTKCHRSNNPINVVKATMDGLTRLKPMTTDLDKIKIEI